jgi:16S rRNA (guanine966-N2)-methyltransferase
MRIISGQFKGRKIFEPKDKKTRPLKDLTKESIFNILQHSKKVNFNLKNTNILDLFSGVGSFGLEALSREANYVTFVENYLDVVSILEKNIKNFELNQKSKVIKKDILNDLDFLNLNQKYDLIFIDPPFKEKNIKSLLLKIYNSKILKSNGIFIIHRNSKDSDEFPSVINILEKKAYGISQIFFCDFN